MHFICETIVSAHKCAVVYKSNIVGMALWSHGSYHTVKHDARDIPWSVNKGFWDNEINIVLLKYK